jgi:hypothetical protein
MANPSPFTPSFGKIPPFMAGRTQLVDDMVQAFENGVGDPNLSTIFVGSRGTGKTALLFHLSAEAAGRGWVAVNATAVPGMLEDIYERTCAASEHLVARDAGGARLSALSVGQVLGLEWERAPEAPGNWRTRMSRLLDGLAARDTGLLITVDEVTADLSEMVQLATVYQHFVGEDRKVALVMAGLPAKVSSLVNNDSVSFLRRACRHRLGRIASGDIEDAMLKTVEEGGRTIAPDALAYAVEAVDGFPYMMQLVGFRMWGRHPEVPQIGMEDAQAGVALARKDFEERVLEATYYDLSRGDLRFLEAMLADPHESRVSDVAKRLGAGSNYASTYKRRLVEQGVIDERARGVVAFGLPGFRAYLEERLG